MSPQNGELMVIVADEDTFQVKLKTLIADYDRDTLVNLYQPLIGYAALALYFTLWSESNNQKVLGVGSHDSLKAKMQLPMGDFIKARKNLEAVGLVKTYLDDNGTSKSFQYDLFAPKTPDEFFNDTLLHGLLIKYIGEKDDEKLKKLYSIDKKKDGVEISASFKEVFNPDFNDIAFMKALENDPKAGRNRAKMSLDFSYEFFFKHLKEISQITENALTKKELSEISRLVALYGSNENRVAEIVANNYNPSLDKGRRLDFVSITKTLQEETNYAYLSSSFSSTKTNSKRNFVSSDNALAKKINLMETISPKDFLTILQGGTQPALSDLRLIDSLSKQFRLPNSVINALIDYTLNVNNNVLSKSYMEKIAASLAREGLTTTVDTMNYLKKISKRGKEIAKPTVCNKEEIKTNKKDSQDDDGPGWDELLDDIGGNDNDGEA